MVAEVVRRAIFSSSDSDTDFGLFNMDADTEPEGSDVPSDPELGRADYWTCIKCKNQKNNPMYRFCEKCYQVKTFLHVDHEQCQFKNHFSQLDFFHSFIICIFE